MAGGGGGGGGGVMGGGAVGGIIYRQFNLEPTELGGRVVGGQGELKIRNRMIFVGCLGILFNGSVHHYIKVGKHYTAQVF